MTRGPIWIDLANSPHVLFFAPVIGELQRRGSRVVVTAREFAQTVALCRTFGIDAEIIGEHGGASVSGKGASLLQRVAGLVAFARRERPSLAVGHNSYSQSLAARLLKVPLVTAMDYEFQPANHLAFRCASLVAVPDAFPLDQLRRQGARPRRTWRYRGLKEHIALAGFSPDAGYLPARGLSGDAALVVVRPPAETALYHRFRNPLFDRVMLRLLGDSSLRVILLPRSDEQRASLAERYADGLVWQGEALDGRQLIAGADAVVSAGGSMNREAAVLGTPAYSLYAGKPAAVDRALAASGRLTFLTDGSDVDSLSIGHKSGDLPAVVDDRLLRAFVDAALRVSR